VDQGTISGGVGEVEVRGCTRYTYLQWDGSAGGTYAVLTVSVEGDGGVPGSGAGRRQVEQRHFLSRICDKWLLFRG
jgi:hypothetical protein